MFSSFVQAGDKMNEINTFFTIAESGRYYNVHEVYMYAS